MENTLQAAGAVQNERRETNGVELTAAGRLLFAAVIAATIFGGWAAYQRYDSAKAPVVPMRQSVAHPAPVFAADAASGAGGAGTSRVAGTAGESVESKLTHLIETLQQERAVHGAQAAAWRSVADTSRLQIAALASQLQAVESKITAMEKVAPAAAAAHVPHEAVADVASSARAVHSALDVAKSTAQVDVGSLPVEAVSAQSLNLTGLGNGVIQLGTQKLAVGQALTPGETIVAVDPVSRSIVTNRRILNVAN
ncbi:MAG: hypothetical protein ACTHNZ_14855 [Trinickia sp.]|uniref:hypothetical protein n=1 Tax=Trinickia sp. TaxID=2571163 RepID=UPI003F809962